MPTVIGTRHSTSRIMPMRHWVPWYHIYGNRPTPTVPSVGRGLAGNSGQNSVFLVVSASFPVSALENTVLAEDKMSVIPSGFFWSFQNLPINMSQLPGTVALPGTWYQVLREPTRWCMCYYP